MTPSRPLVGGRPRSGSTEPGSPLHRVCHTVSMPTGQEDRREALAPGTVLRDYQIESVLGHGGFGIVYRARHSEVDHLVAIKEYLPADLALREGDTVIPRSSHCEAHYLDGLRRFRDEAKALINLPHHPNIIACRDFFRGNGTAYLVMDFVDGQPLSAVLRRRETDRHPFDESDLLAVSVPLAGALVHVHRAGVLHRDVKPANVLIRRADQSPVLVDFGAAKQAVAEHTKSLAPYTEGYAALEQVSDGEVGPWTDIYALGAVMWRIVAGGNHPWDPPNPVKVESRASALMRGSRDPLPSAQELSSDRFSPQLLETIDQCLMVRDSDRVRDSSALLGLLEDCAEPMRESTQHESIKQATAELGERLLRKARTQKNKFQEFLVDSLDGRRYLIALIAVIIIIAGSCMPAFSDRISSYEEILSGTAEPFGSLTTIGNRSFYSSHTIIDSAPGKFILLAAMISMTGFFINKDKVAWIGAISGIIFSSYWVATVPGFDLSWLLILAGFTLLMIGIKSE